MPIYEFRCLGCGHVFELLKLKKESDKNEEIKMKCPKCGHSNVERVLSKVGSVRSRSGGAVRTVKECGGGTCTTIEVPGPKK
jgi:putative FmdB family regulatory protein